MSIFKGILNDCEDCQADDPVTAPGSSFGVECERFVLADPEAVGSDVVISLPEASERFGSGACANQIYIKNISSTNVNTVTVAAFAGEFIDDMPSLVLRRYESITLISDGMAWWIV